MSKNIKRAFALIFTVATILIFASVFLPAKEEAPPPASESEPSADDEIARAPDASEPAEIPPPTPTPKNADEYFDNSVLVGDSIIEGIAQYVRSVREGGVVLGGAKFLTTTIGIRLADCAGDMGADTVYYSYNGGEKPIEQCIGEMGVTKVFIMLGLNDLAGGYDIPATIDRYSRTIDKITSANGGVEVVVLLNTPKVASAWIPDYTPNKSFSNELIDTFVTELRKLCTDKGVKYVDLNTALKDERGALPDDYCRDGYVHLSNAGSAVVIETLIAFAEAEIAPR
jgi:lysophospholipase L1-like esterase